MGSKAASAIGKILVFTGFLTVLAVVPLYLIENPLMPLLKQINPGYIGLTGFGMFLLGTEIIVRNHSHWQK